MHYKKFLTYLLFQLLKLISNRESVIFTAIGENVMTSCLIIPSASSTENYNGHRKIAQSELKN